MRRAAQGALEFRHVHKSHVRGLRELLPHGGRLRLPGGGHAGRGRLAGGGEVVKRQAALGQQRIQRGLDFGVVLFALLLFGIERGDLRHQRVCILAFFLRLPDLCGEAVARCLQLFGFDLRAFARLFEALVFVEREGVAAALQAGGNGGGVLAQQFAVYHVFSFIWRWCFRRGRRCYQRCSR